MNNQGPICLVIGPGALGVTLAALLLDAGARPLFLGRRGAEGVACQFWWSDQVRAIRVPPPRKRDLGTASAVFVTTKAYDLKAAIETHLPSVCCGVPVIPLCNGAVEDELRLLRERFQGYRWRIGFARLGATVRRDESVVLTSPNPRVIWGPLGRSDDSLASEAEVRLVRDSSREVFSWQVDALVLARSKWLLNLTMNSIAAAYRLRRNREVLGHGSLLREVFEEGYRLGAELWGDWRLRREELFHDLLRLIDEGAENENSMARDVRLRRPTERKYFTGLAEKRPGYPLLQELHREIEIGR